MINVHLLIPLFHSLTQSIHPQTRWNESKISSPFIQQLSLWASRLCEWWDSFLTQVPSSFNFKSLHLRLWRNSGSARSSTDPSSVETTYCLSSLKISRLRQRGGLPMTLNQIWTWVAIWNACISYKSYLACKKSKFKRHHTVWTRRAKQILHRAILKSNYTFIKNVR